MDLFTLKYAGKKYRMLVAALEPATVNNRRDPKTYRVSCGAHKRDGESGKMESKPLSLEGNVPLVELVRWAKRKGFLKWNRQGGAKHERHTQRGSAATVSPAASIGSKPKVAG